jgi:hypothetical protein
MHERNQHITSRKLQATPKRVSATATKAENNLTLGKVRELDVNLDCSVTAAGSKPVI